MFTFCRPLTSKKRFLPHRPINNEYSFTLFDRADNVPAGEWDAVTGGQTVFLERAYLRIVEDSGHARLYPRYVIVYHRHKPCGVICYQVVDFKAGLFGGMLTKEVENIRSKRLSLFERYLRSNGEEVLLRLFTCGNNLVSGEYGFRFSKQEGHHRQLELLVAVTNTIAREEKLRGSISAILLKDFYQPLKPKSMLEKEGFIDFRVEPNMVVSIPARTRTPADFIAMFSKKYRNRAKSILAKRNGLFIVEMDQGMLLKHQEEMHALYSAVFARAKFKLLSLSGDYFVRMKRDFPAVFCVKGLFSGARLVAFSSAFMLPDGTLEAHYIGVDYTANEEFELYQNILYLNIETAIERGCSTVNLGRTAAEIKSTVGARPVDLVCYIRPQNAISRLIQRPFISFLQPSPWVQRNPFREESAVGL